MRISRLAVDGALARRFPALPVPLGWFIRQYGILAWSNSFAEAHVPRSYGSALRISRAFTHSPPQLTGMFRHHLGHDPIRTHNLVISSAVPCSNDRVIITNQFAYKFYPDLNTDMMNHYSLDFIICVSFQYYAYNVFIFVTNHGKAIFRKTVRASHYIYHLLHNEALLS